MKVLPTAPHRTAPPVKREGQAWTVAQRIAYWLQEARRTGNQLFANEARRLQLELQRNNPRRQRKALASQPQLPFPPDE